MENMKIENAKYKKDKFTGENTSIQCVIDGVNCGVPFVVGNTHYDEILKQVAAGTLTIEAAD